MLYAVCCMFRDMSISLCDLYYLLLSCSITSGALGSQPWFSSIIWCRFTYTSPGFLPSCSIIMITIPLHITIILTMSLCISPSLHLHLHLHLHLYICNAHRYRLVTEGSLVEKNMTGVHTLCLSDGCYLFSVTRGLHPESAMYVCIYAYM